MTIRIYDVATDEERDLTREDFEAVRAGAESGFLLRGIIAALEPKVVEGRVDWRFALSRLRAVKAFIKAYQG